MNARQRFHWDDINLTRKAFKKFSFMVIFLFAMVWVSSACVNNNQTEVDRDLDLETLETNTEHGILQAERVDHSYVGEIGEGQVIGIVDIDKAGIGDIYGLHDGIVVFLYNRQNMALLISELDPAGTGTFENVELSDFEATVELKIENDIVTGTATFENEAPVSFTATTGTDVGGVYLAKGTVEEPETCGVWVVLSDARQWGCVCVPPYFTNPCCHLLN